MTQTAGPILGAIALVIPQYDAAIAFFCAIGFRLTADLDQGRKRWVTVQPLGGGASLVLAEASDAEQAAAIGTQGAGRVWLFFTRMILLERPPLSPPLAGFSKNRRAMNPMAASPAGATFGATGGT